MSVRYLIVRHGEAEGNREHRFIGQTDVPLSPLGVEQAEAVSARLAQLPISAIIASDLQRASNTVAPLADLLGVEIDHRAGLREIANGEWNLLLPGEVAERWPDMWSRYEGGEDVRRPGGERWADVQARAVSAIEEDAAQRSHGEIVVVGTHGGPTMGLALWAAGLGLERGLFNGPFGPVANASITTLEVGISQNGGRRLLGINDVGHLGDLARVTGTPFEAR